MSYILNGYPDQQMSGFYYDQFGSLGRRRRRGWARRRFKRARGRVQRFIQKHPVIAPVAMALVPTPGVIAAGSMAMRQHRRRKQAVRQRTAKRSAAKARMVRKAGPVVTKERMRSLIDELHKLSR